MNTQRSRRWSSRIAAATTGGLGTFAWSLARAGTAWAHPGHRVGAGPGPWSVSIGVPVARAVLVAGAVPLAGVLLAPIVAGPADRARRRVWLLRSAATTGGAAGLLLGLWSPSRGWVPAGALLVTAVVAGLAGAGPGTDALLGAAVLAGAVLVEPAAGSQLAADIVHLTAAALWVGLVLQLALLSGGPGLARRAARLHRPVVALTAAVVLSGAADAYLHLPDGRSLAGSGYGRLILAKAALVAAAALLGWAGHRRTSEARATTARAWFHGEAAGLTAVTVLAGALVLAPLPAGAAPGQVAFGTTTAGPAGGPVSVVAVPSWRPRAGELVFVGIGGGSRPPGSVTVIAPTARAVAHPLGAGRYVAALTRTGPGLTRVWVRVGGRSWFVRLSAAGAAVPAGPPSPDALTLDAVIGRLAALRLTPTLEPPAPLDQAPQDRAQGAALADYLRSRGIRAAGLAFDAADSRSQAFRVGFRTGFGGSVAESTGSPAHLPAGDALVLAGSPAQATALLDRPRQEITVTAGVFLAPWLLTPPVLDDAIEGGPAISVASGTDPAGPTALQFLSAEGNTTPGFTPTYDALTAFTTALGPGNESGSSGRDGTVGFRLYAVTAVQFLPRAIDDHNHGVGGWFTTGGQLVPVTPPLG